MTTHIQSDTNQPGQTGFKRRINLFIEQPLLGFIEQELLNDQIQAKEHFFEGLTAMVEEFGCKYRKLTHKNKYHSISTDSHMGLFRERLNQINRGIVANWDFSLVPGNAKGVMDVYRCEIPACFVDVMVISILAQRCDEKIKVIGWEPAHSKLLEALFIRCQQLLNLPKFNVELLAHPQEEADNLASLAQYCDAAISKGQPVVDEQLRFVI